MISSLPPFVLTALSLLAEREMTRKPDQILHEYGQDYMRRWILAKDYERGSVYIQQILRSDYDEELHDHPGDNMSIILSGAMTEILDNGSRQLHPGNVVTRKAGDRHRLLLDEPATTIWIMGERIREWGFWDKEGTFIPSQKFFEQRGQSIA